MLVVPTSEEIVGRDVGSAVLSEEQLSWYKDFRNRLHSDGTKYSGKKDFGPTIVCGVFEETTTYLPVIDGTYPTHTRSKSRLCCGFPCQGVSWITQSVEQEATTPSSRVSGPLKMDQAYTLPPQMFVASAGSTER